MSALKLFVSHSSRLGDVHHKYTRNDRNWRLLEDTCKVIQDKYKLKFQTKAPSNCLYPWNYPKIPGAAVWLQSDL